MLFKAENLRLVIETCCAVVHYRDDLTAIFLAAQVPTEILTSVPPPSNPEWGHTKREIARHVVMTLASMPDNGGLGPLRRIVAQLADWRNYASAKDPERARSLVRQLNAEIRAQSQGRRGVTPATAPQAAQAVLARDIALQEHVKKVEELREVFLNLMQWPETRAAERGYRFQDLVHELFQAAGLQPRKPYRLPGQEIDGSFTLDFENYLLEARWQKERVAFQEISGFSGKVERKIECTRGVFIAVNGFSDGGVEAFQSGKRANIVLVEGVHLMYVLDGHVHLADLLRAVLEAAATRETIRTPLAQLRL